MRRNDVCKSCGSPVKSSDTTAELTDQSDEALPRQGQEVPTAGGYSLSRQDVILIVSMLALSALMILIFALTL
jgi:hypothetical protein